MTKLIGIKELQQNTKFVRNEVKKGVRFIVIYRSKPVFEIIPLTKNKFAEDLEQTGLYNDEFLKMMKNAEKDIKENKINSYTTEEFLKSLR